MSQVVHGLATTDPRSEEQILALRDALKREVTDEALIRAIDEWYAFTMAVRAESMEFRTQRDQALDMIEQIVNIDPKNAIVQVLIDAGAEREQSELTKRLQALWGVSPSIADYLISAVLRDSPSDEAITEETHGYSAEALAVFRRDVLSAIHDLIQPRKE